MVKRLFWLKKIEQAWKERSIIWLSGVRRAGKTVLCQSLPVAEYFDCELPRVRRMMEDPESFLDDVKGKTIILDEIHRLGNPSELLKIAADHYPATRILATGSSMLGASAKFRDTLAGRKTELWLTPLCFADLADFKRTDIPHRFLYGGLPPFFLARTVPEKEFQEWMDAYWAKDIQELFRLERRHSFLKFTELLMAQSGGIFEANSFARPCEVSRGTISNYLSVLESTYVVHVVRPFSTHRPTEIVSAPKVYAFDTGFACTYRGWHELRRDDYGILWEQIVLNELHAHLQSRRVSYWRDKRGHEVDFVLAEKLREPISIECKWSAGEFDSTGMAAFRRQYPKGDNYCVSSDVAKPFTRAYGVLKIRFVNARDLITGISGQARF